MHTRDSVHEIEFGNNLKQYSPNNQHGENNLEKDCNFHTTDHVYDYATSDQYISSDKSSNDYSQEFPLLQCNKSFISNSKANIIH